MSRNPRPRFFIYMAPLALAAIFLSQHTFAQKPTVVSSVSAPLTLSLTSNATSVTSCADNGSPKVQLNARAVSPSGNPIKYRWTTPDGVIIGEGPTVT